MRRLMAGLDVDASVGEPVSAVAAAASASATPQPSCGAAAAAVAQKAAPPGPHAAEAAASRRRRFVPLQLSGLSTSTWETLGVSSVFDAGAPAAVVSDVERLRTLYDTLDIEGALRGSQFDALGIEGALRGSG